MFSRDLMFLCVFMVLLSEAAAVTFCEILIVSSSSFRCLILNLEFF